MPQDSLELALSSRLRFYNLEGTRLKIFQGDSPDGTNSLKSSSVKDVYEISQAAINAKQAKIDSLTNIIATDRAEMHLSGDIMPELKVVFPQIKEIAITKAVFANPGDGATDTVNVAMIYAPGVNHTRREELQRYLEARLRLEKIRVVEVPASLP